MGTAERMRTVDDTTPLNGETIDVAARVAWTVRMARITAPAHIDARLRTLADLIGSSPAHLSRVETGQRRDGAVVDGYERALGLPAGSLRAPVDVLCRTFPRTSPRDQSPGTPLSDVRALSELTERLGAGEDVTADDWLVWARAMSVPGNVGLPVRIFADLTHRLVAELGRTIGHAYPVRYEALAKLRCSHYGDVVTEVAHDVISQPYLPGLYDVMSAVAEAYTEDVVAWCLELLSADRPELATGGALAIENLGSIAGPPLWERIAPDLVAVFDAAEPGSDKEDWCTHLLRLVPVSVWQAGAPRPSRPLPPPTEIPRWDREAENEMWQACVLATGRVCAQLDVPDQPMLARLLFDISFGHWETRAVTGYMLLDALPRVSELLGPEFQRLHAQFDDPQVRQRIVRRVAHSVYAHDASSIGGWLASDDPDLRRAALVAAGAAGHLVPAEALRAALAEPRHVRAALYSAGMSQHPVLEELVADATLDDAIRSGAAWWRTHGGRLEV